MKRLWWVILAGLLMGFTPRPPLVVSPTGPYTSLTAALASAQPGDTIEVHSGTYFGSVVIDKPVKLIGLDRPVIDGQGQGTVVSLNVAGSELRGFVVQNSGTEPDRNDAGIAVNADNIIVADNQLQEVLVGIFVAEADQALIENNSITGMSAYETGRKGDAIRVWYSQDVTLNHNHIFNSRDLVSWYSKNLVFTNNLIETSRYGIHLMYSDEAQLLNNHLRDNSVGAYVMYSNNVTIEGNFIQGQRGPSGYALGFKDVDNATVQNNVLSDNGAGFFIDGMPFTGTGFGKIENNLVAFNDVGVILLPAVKNNEFLGNSFWENSEQVSIHGGGVPAPNLWQGNFWSDYTGFDADGNGRGETPYQAERFFEGLTDREPRLRMLAYSPAVQALELAGQAFPIIKPQPKLVDEQPSLTPLPLPAAWQTPPQKSWWWPVFSASLLTFAAFIGWFSQFQPRNKTMAHPSHPTTGSIIQTEQVSKKYGVHPVLQQVTFTLPAGSSLALWGENGAGKTTLIKALLGVISINGRVLVNGRDVAQEGKLARQAIGYVPQELTFHDWNVLTTLNFYAQLKGVAAGQERLNQLLHQLGLTPHLHKSVTALSGGLKQRLALAIALLNDPPILLLDEPTANLDVQTRREYLILLAHLRQSGKTLIFASHRLEEVDLLADQVLWLEQGAVKGMVTPEVLRQQIEAEIALLEKKLANENGQFLTINQPEETIQPSWANGSSLHPALSTQD